MTPPQPLNNQIMWNISDSNLEFRFKPFYHCQGVPIIISKIDLLGIETFIAQIDEDTVVLKYTNNSRDLNNNLHERKLENENFVVTLTAETDTIIPLSNSAQILIYINNSAPEFESYSTIIYAEKPLQKILTIMCRSSDNLNSTDSSILVSDANSDSIYISAILNGLTLSDSSLILNSQNSIDFIAISTSSLNAGYNLLQIKIWDIFHSSTPSQIDITFNVIYNPAPYFTEPFPSNLSAQI